MPSPNWSAPHPIFGWAHKRPGRGDGRLARKRPEVESVSGKFFEDPRRAGVRVSRQNCRRKTMAHLRRTDGNKKPLKVLHSSEAFTILYFLLSTFYFLFSPPRLPIGSRAGRQACHTCPIGVHNVDFIVPIPEGGEHDPVSIRRQLGTRLSPPFVSWTRPDPLALTT